MQWSQARAVLQAEEAFGRAAAGLDERAVALVDVGGDQLGALGVGAGDDQGRDAADVGGEARGDEVADMRLVGISTLPPMWPHFFSEASWSSKWTPAAPASMKAFMISKLLSGPPKPASASATIGANQSRVAPPSACSIWSARCRVRLMRRQSSGAALAGIEGLVGIHGAGGVGVGGDLPAGEIDRLQPGADHLHGLVAGDRAQRVDVGLVFSSFHSFWRRARPGCGRSAPSRAAARRRPGE